jgi:F-type H+-transporting ATPase subunit c
MKKIVAFSLAILATLSVSVISMAADTTVTVAALNTISTLAWAAGLGIAIGVLAPGLAQGMAVFGATTGIARNPEAADKIRLTMLIGLALMESLAIYALVIALLLLYAFPYSDTIRTLAGVVGA